MKEIFKFDKRYFKISLYVVVSICLILLFYQIISNASDVLDWIFNALRWVIKLFSPVIYGFVMAYLLHKPCRRLAQVFQKLKFLKKQRLKHVLAVLIVNVAAVILLVLIFYILVPNIVESISRIVGQADQFVAPLQDFFYKLSDNDAMIQILGVMGIDVNNIAESPLILSLLEKGREILESLGTYLLGFLLNTGTFLYNFIVGFFIAIYVNLDFDQLIHQFRSLFTVLMPKRYQGVVKISNLANEMFFKYLIGKGICSIIVGVVFYIAALISHAEYALLMALIVTITNMIPLFGPFIGAVPVFVFGLLTGLNITLILLVIIIFLQQVDGNFLTPKIVGDIVRLNGFWVIVSIIVCGKLFGIIGMIIAIPLFAMLRTLLREWIEKRRVKLSLKMAKSK